MKALGAFLMLALGGGRLVSYRVRLSHPKVESPRTNRTGDRVGFTVMGMMAKRRISHPCRRSNPVFQFVVDQCKDWTIPTLSVLPLSWGFPSPVHKCVWTGLPPNDTYACIMTTRCAPIPSRNKSTFSSVTNPELRTGDGNIRGGTFVVMHGLKMLLLRLRSRGERNVFG
jgi:hypothetical protein